MQCLELTQQYQCFYIAGASFCLMDHLEDAQEAIHRVYQHLVPGDSFLLFAFRPKLTPQPSIEKSVTLENGSTISVRSLAQSE